MTTNELSRGGFFALGTSINGGRPSFSLTLTEDNGSGTSATMYELLQEGQAEARRKRMKKVGKPVKTFKVEKILNGNRPPEIEKWSWDEWKAVKVERLDPSRFETASNLVRSTIRDIQNPDRGSLEDWSSLPLPEPAGVRLALAFIGMKPIQRIDRLRAFAREISRMSMEECYYWHAKCRSPNSPNGAKALRVLLTDHIR